MPIDKEVYDRRMRVIGRSFAVLTFLFFVILVGYMVLLINVRHVSHKAVILSQENRRLIQADIQQAKEDKHNRIIACQHGYTGISEVFEIFFVKHPDAKVQKNIDRFNKRIDDLVQACSKPTKKGN